jgi:hypothetical protein
MRFAHLPNCRCSALVLALEPSPKRSIQYQEALQLLAAPPSLRQIKPRNRVISFRLYFTVRRAKQQRAHQEFTKTQERFTSGKYLKFKYFVNVIFWNHKWIVTTVYRLLLLGVGLYLPFSSVRYGSPGLNLWVPASLFFSIPQGHEASLIPYLCCLFI